MPEAWEPSTKSTFYGEPASLCDAGSRKIKTLSGLD